MRTALATAALMAALVLAAKAGGQATARPCGPDEAVGPACLLTHQPLSTLPRGSLFWYLQRFPSAVAATRAAGPRGTVATAFGSTWLFTVERRDWRPRGDGHVARIGPLPMPAAASAYAAEYLRSVFSPGMAAPLHVHSGPEAFFAVDGDTCLETPDGVQVGRGAGNALVIRGGPPMLLMAIGTAPRRGFALVLHPADWPPTTLTQVWRPPGGCADQLKADHARANAKL